MERWRIFLTVIITGSFLVLGILWKEGYFFPGLLKPGTERKESINKVSPEEFRNLMRNAQERHGGGHGDSISTRSTNESNVDTQLREIWKKNYDDRLLEQLESVDIIARRPESFDGSIHARRLSGRPFNLSDFSGQWVVLNFWATWCPPCREEMPSLNRLHDKLSDKVTIVGVNIGEKKETVQSFVEEQDLTFTMLLDRSRAIAETFDVRALPESWIIDPEGRVVGSALGPRDWDEQEMIELFKHLDPLDGDDSSDNS